MISRDNFNKINILKTAKEYNLNLQTYERCLFALALLEALIISGAKFIFKGGTSLLLLLDDPKRLSTDIDILVDPDYNIDHYLEVASQTYPFISKNEVIRETNSLINKRHFHFYYNSILEPDKNLFILLDVLYEKNNYPTIIDKELNSKYIKVDGCNLKVSMPGINSLLGDKLTAFAPNTIGIQFFSKNKEGKIIDKRREVIKQFFDIAILFNNINSFDHILESYIKISECEARYRNLDINYLECLIDSFKSALSIYTSGKYEKSLFDDFLVGIKKLDQYLINTTFNLSNSYKYAEQVILLISGLICNINTLNIKISENIEITNKFILYMKKLDEQSCRKVQYCINLINSKFPHCIE